VLLSWLDPIEAAEAEMSGDTLARPALLVAWISQGQRCDSCKAFVAAGLSMMTFRYRDERPTQIGRSRAKPISTPLRFAMRW